jgi:hypothetical protein
MTAEVLHPQLVPTLPNYLPANDKTEVPQAQLGWLRPTPRDTPISEMRARLDQDGYVLVKGVIPREDVLKMREQYADVSSTIGAFQTRSNFPSVLIRTNIRACSAILPPISLSA